MSEGESSLSRVVVATDFSPAAGRAVAAAAELARARGATLTLVHVVGTIPTPLGRAHQALLAPEVEATLQEAARRKLAEATARLGASQDVEDWLEPEGDPARRICEVAGKVDADLIVVGTRGHSALAGRLLGGTAARVLRQAPCPVLAIPPEEDARVSFPPRRVVAACDFSEESVAAVRAMARLLQGSGARATLLHADHLPLLLQPLVAELEVPLSSFEDVAETLREELEPLAEQLRAAGLEADIAVRSGDPSAVITEYAAEENADWIVLGTHGRAGVERLLLGSTAERTLRHADCAVLACRLPG